MKNVLVMMSTYNGEMFLREQLDSVVAQKDVNISILVRDDGSTDGTQAILNEYKKDGKLIWYTGENKKPAYSFIDLVFMSDTSYDYYAFCDQDDYWLPDKLIAAVEIIDNESSELPMLYYCNPEVVDAKRNHITTRQISKQWQFFDLMLLVYCVPGCTMVFNRSLHSYLRLHKPTYVTMHDCWVYYTCVAVGGKVYGDETPYIQYRQHDNNVIGISKITLDKKIRMIIGKRTSPRQKMVSEILYNYRDIVQEGRLKEKMILFSNYPNCIFAKLKLLSIKKHEVPLRSVIKAKLRIIFNSL